MAGSDPVLTIPAIAPVVIARDRVCTSSVSAFRAGVQAAPVAPWTYKILNTRTGSEVASYAPDLSTSSPTITTDPADFVGVETGEHYQERWTGAWDADEVGVTRAVIRQVVIALYPLAPPVGEAEILGEYPDLVENLGQYGTTLQPYLDAAWARVVRKLIRNGIMTDTVVEPSDLFDAHFETTCEVIYRSLIKFQPNNERWSNLWQHHKDAAVAAVAGNPLLRDRDRDGLPETLARAAPAATLIPNVAWSQRRRRDPRFG